MVRTQTIRPTPRSLGALVLSVLLALAASSALAGTITGVIMDADTGAPLYNIDLDVYDVSFRPVDAFDDGSGSLPNDNTAQDGTFALEVAAGEYYVRADPSTAQGYVGVYYPNNFLQSEAHPVTVRATGSVELTFFLQRGVQVTGSITDAAGGAPLGNIDIDVYGSDGSFLSTTTALSDDSGNYAVGNLPPGNFYIKANPHGVGMYVPQFWPGAATLADAQPVAVTASGATGVDFHLELGGAISGVVTAGDTGSPLAGIDMDLFDANRKFLPTLNATTDAAGAFSIAGLPVGTYYVQADPSAGQGYVDTFFGGAFDISGASAVDVSAGINTTSTSISLPLGGTIGGVVTSAVTGQPLGDVGITLFDGIGNTKLASTRTKSDGTYLVGAVPTGGYMVRCSGVKELGLAYEYHSNAVVAIQALPVAINAGSSTPGINFALDRGGWIRGKVTLNAQPYTDVDLHVYTTSGALLPVNAVTSADGSYEIGPVPVGTFKLRASPPSSEPYRPLWYGGASNLTAATAFDVTAGGTLQNIDVAFGTTPPPTRGAHLFPEEVAASPNPFNPATTISFALPAASHVRVTIHDARGRVVAVLADRELPAGPHQLSWNGRTSTGEPSPSGVHFLRIDNGTQVVKQKLILLK